MERGCMYIVEEETLWSGVGKGSEDQIGLPSLFMLCPFLSRWLGPPTSTSHDALQLRWMMLPFSPHHWKLPHLSCDRIPASPFKLAIKRSKGRKKTVSSSLQSLYFFPLSISALLGILELSLSLKFES
jgi:hypothetical protein